MTAHDDLLPVPKEQLAIEATLFPLEPLKVLAAEGAISTTFLDLSKGDSLSPGGAADLLHYFGLMYRSIRWWIGDALLYFEKTLPEEFSQVIESLGLTEPTARTYMFVCGNVPPSRRKVNLGIGVHEKVARLNPQEQAYWLNRASRANWTLATLTAEMAAKRKDERPIIPGGAVDAPSVIEAARRVVSSKQDYGADWLVPREPMAVLIAALGEEDAEAAAKDRGGE